MPKNKENYLDKIPVRNSLIGFTENEDGRVDLIIENKGLFNKIAQKLFKKPKVSFIHLDELGSFVWTKIDGERSILDIGKDVEEKFGESANPLYERLSKFFGVVASYGFIEWKK